MPAADAPAAHAPDGDDDGEVRAAGGLVWRPADSDGIEVLLVHRPRYDDWTLPKGKAEPGETFEDCARREVEEETGLRCTLGAELPSVRYVDGRGRPKVVRYWAMTPQEGAFAENGEVDEVRWMAPEAAAARLSYPRDRAVVEGHLAST